MNRILSLGFDPSEIEVPTFRDWSKECSPIPEGYYDVHDDDFFVDWIAEGVKVSPGKTNKRPKLHFTDCSRIRRVNTFARSHTSQFDRRCEKLLNSVPSSRGQEHSAPIIVTSSRLETPASRASLEGWV